MSSKTYTTSFVALVLWLSKIWNLSSVFLSVRILCPSFFVARKFILFEVPAVF
jgi:hypothetical protein